MNYKSLGAWTLPELLVVMILSGLIFLSLLEASDLIHRVSIHVTQKWTTMDEELNAWQQVDNLFAQVDSVSMHSDGFQLYRREAPLAFIRQSDNLLLCDYRERRDTLFRCVKEILLEADTVSLLLQTGNREVRYSWKIRKIIWL